MCEFVAGSHLKAQTVHRLPGHKFSPHKYILRNRPPAPLTLATAPIQWGMRWHTARCMFVNIAMLKCASLFFLVVVVCVWARSLFIFSFFVVFPPASFQWEWRLYVEGWYHGTMSRDDVYPNVRCVSPREFSTGGGGVVLESPSIEFVTRLCPTDVLSFGIVAAKCKMYKVQYAKCRK